MQHCADVSLFDLEREEITQMSRSAANVRRQLYNRRDGSPSPVYSTGKHAYHELKNCAVSLSKLKTANTVAATIPVKQEHRPEIRDALQECRVVLSDIDPRLLKPKLAKQRIPLGRKSENKEKTRRKPKPVIRAPATRGQYEVKQCIVLLSKLQQPCKVTKLKYKKRTPNSPKRIQYELKDCTVLLPALKSLTNIKQKTEEHVANPQVKYQLKKCMVLLSNLNPIMENCQNFRNLR